MSHKLLSLTDLESNLRDANEALEIATRQAAVARNAETTARNRVNDVQRQIDAKIADLKKAAPLDSDWKRRETIACG